MIAGLFTRADGLAQERDELFFFCVTKTGKHAGVLLCRGCGRRCLFLARLIGQPDPFCAAVRRVVTAQDQPVPLHARQGVGHRRLLDPDQRYEIPLRQTVLLPKVKHDWKDSGRQAHWLDTGLKRRRKEAREMIDQVTGRGVRGQCHSVS